MRFLLNNPEVRKSLLVSAIISAAATVGAYLQRPSFGLYTLIVCAVLFTAQLLATYRRYRRIARLSGEIDTLLHGSTPISPGLYSEGELAILSSEIYKLTVRLREQQHRLLNDKKFLADSIADISHQIRTPLTSINLLASFLSQPELSNERRGQLTRELAQLLKRIDWLINALLKISRLDAGTIFFKKERILLDDLLRKASEPLLIPIELRGQSIEISASGGFEGDLSWTCEALGNILKNCVEHTPEGGTFKLSARENAIYSEIIITDNGAGIDPKDLPHVFERFYQGKNPNPGGIGIGLALARMIIAGQGGVIKAENRLSGGAKFIIRFYKENV